MSATLASSTAATAPATTAQRATSADPATDRQPTRAPTMLSPLRFMPLPYSCLFAAPRRAAGLGDHRPARDLPRVSRVLVATHNGSFHADDVFAIAAVGLLDEPIEVVRTRDRDA